MEDIFETLLEHNCSWLKGGVTFYKYQGFWNYKDLVEGTILAQQSFKAQPSDVLLSSCPKTGTTWLKALAFAIATRDKFDDSTSRYSQPCLMNASFSLRNTLNTLKTTTRSQDPHSWPYTFLTLHCHNHS